MSRGPYTVVPLLVPAVGGTAAYDRGTPREAPTVEEARRIARACYDSFGVIPDVLDHAGRPTAVYTNEEVSKWGLA